MKSYSLVFLFSTIKKNICENQSQLVGCIKTGVGPGCSQGCHLPTPVRGRTPRTAPAENHVLGDLFVRSHFKVHLPGPPNPSEYRVLLEGWVIRELRTRSEGSPRTSPAAGSPRARAHPGRVATFLPNLATGWYSLQVWPMFAVWV